MKILLIALGGGLGAVARYWLTTAIHSRGWSSMFAGTLVVNVLGCFAIGFAAHWFATATNIREDLRLALIVGLLGGFTTFSSYVLESFVLLESGARVAALANILLSNVLGLLAAWAGFAIAARWLTSAGS